MEGRALRDVAKKVGLAPSSLDGVYWPRQPHAPFDSIKQRFSVAQDVAWAGVRGCGLVSLLVVFYAGEKSRDLRAWDEYVAKARAEGRKLTMAEHLQPDIPDEENFAAAPIFVDLFARREAWSPFRAFNQIPKRVPMSDAASGTAIDLGLWRKQLQKAGLLSPDARGQRCAERLRRSMEGDRGSCLTAQSKVSGKMGPGDRRFVSTLLGNARCSGDKRTALGNEPSRRKS